MNRIDAKFRALKSEGRAALIVYLTAGDPHLDETAGLILEAERAGADLIELGVPWSDPSADGPVIQAAMERALATGGAGQGTLAKTFAVVKAVREKSQIPIVLFGYYNPLLQRGLARVAGEARAAGVDGFLVVDLPPEESEELDVALSTEGLVRIPLLAPTTSLERAKRAVARGGGFAYYVALTGVTGARHLDVEDVAARVAELRGALGDLPLAVGFGIRDPAGARAVGALSSGVVVGSAFVQAVAAAKDAASRRTTAYALVKSLRDAL